MYIYIYVSTHTHTHTHTHTTFFQQEEAVGENKFLGFDDNFVIDGPPNAHGSALHSVKRDIHSVKTDVLSMEKLHIVPKKHIPGLERVSCIQKAFFQQRPVTHQMSRAFY